MEWNDILITAVVAFLLAVTVGVTWALWIYKPLPVAGGGLVVDSESDSENGERPLRIAPDEEAGQ